MNNDNTNYKLIFYLLLILFISFFFLFFFKFNKSSKLTSRQAQFICREIIKKKIDLFFINLHLITNSSFNPYSKYLVVNINATDSKNNFARGYCIFQAKYNDNNIILIKFRLSNKKSLFLYRNVVIKIS